MGTLVEGIGTSNSATFFNVRGGKLVERSTSENPKAVAREKKDGTTVYELHHPNLTGKLTRCYVRSHDQYGDFLRLKVKTSGKSYIVEMNFNSGYAESFLRTIPTANLEQLIKISPNFKETAERKDTTIFLEQESGVLKRFFTKDNKNGLPDAVKTTFNGKEAWDYTTRIAFYKEMIQKLDAKLIELYGDKQADDTNDPEPEASESEVTTNPTPTGVEKVPF